MYFIWVLWTLRTHNIPQRAIYSGEHRLHLPVGRLTPPEGQEGRERSRVSEGHRGWRTWEGRRNAKKIATKRKINENGVGWRVPLCAVGFFYKVKEEREGVSRICIPERSNPQ